MKELQRREDLDINLFPGDKLILWYDKPDGTYEKVLSQEIKDVMHVDTAVIFETEDGELGLEYGIGGVFGKKAKK